MQLEGGEENILDNNLIEQTINRIGANRIGKQMFDEVDNDWSEETLFHSSEITSNTWMYFIIYFSGKSFNYIIFF